ncbi:MAG: 50S ribosomal protein L6 [Candidatus Wallbacteria bacterium]|nr:50S ribosomal protein L6 [Candidatus Wallbacteria bacterium]
MSRIGKKVIKVPQGVTIKHDEKAFSLSVKGPKGENSLVYNRGMKVVVNAGEITVARPDDDKNNRALHGLTNKLISNLVCGVSQGFEKSLTIMGVGYRALVKDRIIELSVGFSHPVEMKMPVGVSAKVEKSLLTLYGIDREVLGQFAADVRAVRPPEPYKGAGIRYTAEHVRKKAGKKAA